MNPTIVKIIDLMFRGMPEREEIRAMREELLTNSQARYDDLIASGKSSNEALGEVLDNLRGVEELLDEYRREDVQTSAPEQPFAYARFEKMAEEIDRRFAAAADDVKSAADRASTTAEAAFGTAMESVRTAMDSFASGFNGRSAGFDHSGAAGSGEWVRSNVYGGGELLVATADPAHYPRVRVELAADEVELLPSGDGLIHVEIGPEDESLLLVEKSGGCFTLRRNPVSVEPEPPAEDEQQEGFFGFLNGLGRMLRGTIRQMRSCYGLIRVKLPAGLAMAEVQTASGDIGISDLQLGGLSATSASGDINISDCIITGNAAACNTSGDTDLHNVKVGGSLKLNATSGDIMFFEGSASVVTANNVSGDTEISGVLGQVQSNSVSGDIDICIYDTSVTGIFANTTSGDITVGMEEALTPAVTANTTSGDVDIACDTDPASAVRFRLNTVSGDICVS